MSADTKPNTTEPKSFSMDDHLSDHDSNDIEEQSYLISNI